MKRFVVNTLCGAVGGGFLIIVLFMLDSLLQVFSRLYIKDGNCHF